MHSQTLAPANLLTPLPDRAAPGPARVRPDAPARSRQEYALVVSVVSAPVVLTGLWFVVGWPGVAAGSALFAIVAAWQWHLARAEFDKSLLALEQLANELAESQSGVSAPAALAGRWHRVAQRLIDAQGTLARQLKERPARDQKLELAHRLAVANQRRAEAVLDSLTDAVLVTNSFGELLVANPSAERLFEFKSATAIGNPLGEVIRHSVLDLLIRRVTGRGAGHQRHSEELSLPVDGKPRWFKVTIAAVVDRTSEPIGFVTALRDVTSEKAAHARSTEFVSAVSHEVKTPLASVKAYAEMLADGDAQGDPETQQKFLGIIQTQTDRMTRLLEGMLDMARIESGVVRVDKKLVSLNELIDGGAKLMEPAAVDKKITIERRLSSLYLGVVVDADMMSRVVMNLVSNAIKYTDCGGRIVLKSQMIGDAAAFDVEDTGRGIPAEAMAKLFQKFYRVKENAHVAPGTGLGLSLVKHIVEEVHGGRVDVESEVGKGSTFRVRLKLEGNHAATWSDLS